MLEVNYGVKLEQATVERSHLMFFSDPATRLYR